MPKFKPGQSGNPKGPPKGLGPVQKLRRAIEQDIPEILQGMVTAAKAGDTAAAKLLLDRVVPALKPETRPAAEAVSGEPGAILQAAAEGRLTYEQATALMSLAVDRAKVAELVEIQERLQRIEAMLKH